MIPKLIATILMMAAIGHGETPAGKPEITFPTERTITDSQGRRMDVTLTGKTDKTVKFIRKSDHKDFELPFDKLSKEDQALVAALTARKPRVLVLDDSQKILETLRNHQLDPVALPMGTTPGVAGTSCDISRITSEELSNYDIVWDGNVPLGQRKQWRELLKNYGGVVCIYFPAVTTRNQWLDDKNPTLLKEKPFLGSDKNFVFYNPHEISKEGRITATDTSIYQKVIEIALKQLDSTEKNMAARGASAATIARPPALAATSSIKLDVKTEKGEIGIAGGQKMNGLITTATPAFEKGADMSDGPALVRIIRIQQNNDREDRHAMARSCPTSKIEPWIFKQGEKEGIWFLWFAEVWQDGKLVCKTYNTNKHLEKLPPAREGEQSVKLYPDKK